MINDDVLKDDAHLAQSSQELPRLSCVVLIFGTILVASHRPNICQIDG